MLLIASAMLAIHMVAPQPPVTLKKGLILSQSCHIIPSEYLLPTAEGSKRAGDEEIPSLSPAVTVRGNNIVVDFSGAVLRGTVSTAEPSDRKGLGIVIEGKNVTITNLHVHGYKVGLWAKNCKNLHIVNCDFSNNWKQHLMSTSEKEDESDWQSYHHNEHNEWLRYGAGMYLEGCDAFTVTNTKANGGQCGLMLVRSNNGTVKNNDFSFMSGVGLGLYCASNNRVLNNKIDWCVRGFSYGVYNRGQDSAGILIFELCNSNVFAFNSVTHGGDGFFLWAGQTMMDTGKGGCNDNLLYGNDFSHSPCNAIEATFSRNSFVNNKLVECWHGVWGGYSFDTKILANVFGFNGEAIAIEHGQDNVINHNLFQRDNAAINLWQDPITDKNWAYPKHHDTLSRDYQISQNRFEGISTTPVVVRNTVRIRMANNEFRECAGAIKETGDNSGSQIEIGRVIPGDVPPRTIANSGQPVPGTSDNVEEYLSRLNIPWSPFADVAQLKKKPSLTEPEQRVLDAGISVPNGTTGQNPFLRPGTLKGQRYILVGEWGPYDFKSPILWPRQVLSGNRRRFEVLGPKGHWRLKSKTSGIEMNEDSGIVPGFVDVTLPESSSGLTAISLEYTGGATTDYRGIVMAAGKPVAFGYQTFLLPIDWNIKFFKWDESTDPRTHDDAFKSVIAGTPVKELKVNKLDFAGSSFDQAVGNDHFATVCDGSFQVPAGRYKLELTTDDGARAWVDGKPVVTTAWKYQGPTTYTADLKLDGGKHKIRIEHFQIDGYARLKLDLEPVGRK